MWGYRAREVAKMLGLSVAQVRAYVREGFLTARKGPRGELRFGFQDLVLLRAASGLLSARVAPRRVRSALRKLRNQIPEGKNLAGVHIVAEGDQVVVRDGTSIWQPESGQVLFDFDVTGLAEKVAPLVQAATRMPLRDPKALTADDWYAWAYDLEDASPAQAREAYLRAVTLDPDHADAHVNLGRLFHEAGDLGQAEAEYEAALRLRPDDSTAGFNLGVVLEDAGKHQEALVVYERTLLLDPSFADAHFNAARLYERLQQRPAALRHLSAYRKLTKDR